MKIVKSKAELADTQGFSGDPGGAIPAAAKSTAGSAGSGG
jgi:hypothetical protein